MICINIFYNIIMAKKSKCTPNMTYVLCVVIILLIVYLLYNNYKERFQDQQEKARDAVLTAAKKFIAESNKLNQIKKKNQGENKNKSDNNDISKMGLINNNKA